MRLRFLLPLLASLLLGACAKSPEWAMNDVTGHLPDLEFNLLGAGNQPVTAADLRGKLVLMYFGYTHCPDICPLSMTHLHQALVKLGPAAEQVRIVFISLDPARDTPALLQAYARAFDPRAIGLTGPLKTVQKLAKRYRIGFSLGKPDQHGNYDVSHSSAVFVFDRDGRARLLATSADNVDAVVHDLTLLLEQSP
ncbi:MAG TPA: SCO family protein [Rhodanobacteraceae bacterium]|nr:SCO family protein [Rhodanobacteraceae bacterium]